MHEGGGGATAELFGGIYYVLASPHLLPLCLSEFLATVDRKPTFPINRERNCLSASVFSQASLHSEPQVSYQQFWKPLPLSLCVSWHFHSI